MSFTHGKNANFQLADSGATVRDLSAYVDKVSGLPGGRNLSDVTAFGASGVAKLPGLQDVSFTVEGSFDSTATTGPHVVINGLRTTTTASSFVYGPEGSTTGKTKLTGNCWLKDYKVDATVTDKVSFSAEFQVDGVVTNTVF